MKTDVRPMLRTLAAAVLAGAATGGRSLSGVAALTVTAPAGSDRLPDRVLGRPVVKALLSLAAAGESVADKLPAVPSRLAPLSLAARALGAATSGWILARRAPRRRSDGGVARQEAAQVLASVALATGTALLTAWLGSRWRSLAGPRFGNDLLPAVAEDAAVVGLAAGAAKLAE